MDTFQCNGQGFDDLMVEKADVTTYGTKKPNWKEFDEAIKKLNKKAPSNVDYKVIFLARHGQGYHVRFLES